MTRIKGGCLGTFTLLPPLPFFFKKKISFVSFCFCPGGSLAALVSQAMFLCLLVVVSGRGGIAWLVFSPYSQWGGGKVPPLPFLPPFLMFVF